MAALLLSGCASSSGIIPMEGGLYRVSTTAITSYGGAGTAANAALKAAQKHCTSLGKQAVVVNADSKSGITQGDSSLTFRCE